MEPKVKDPVRQMLDILGTLTKAEFLDAFKKVTNIVKDMGDRNAAEIAAMQKNIALLTTRLSDSSNTALNSLTARIESFLAQKNKDIDTKLSLVQDGTDGEDGKDVDVDAVITAVLSKIPAVDLQPVKDEFNARLDEFANAKPVADPTALPKGMAIYGPGKTKVLTVDLSTLLDGAKTSFYIGTNFGIISVSSSSAPFGAFRPVIDYNGVGMNIEFTSNVDAPSQLAAGQNLIITYLK